VHRGCADSSGLGVLFAAKSGQVRHGRQLGTVGRRATSITGGYGVQPHGPTDGLCLRAGDADTYHSEEDR
jgi:hypothetical protein